MGAKLHSWTTTKIVCYRHIIEERSRKKGVRRKIRAKCNEIKLTQTSINRMMRSGKDAIQTSSIYQHQKPKTIRIWMCVCARNTKKTYTAPSLQHHESGWGTTILREPWSMIYKHNHFHFDVICNLLLNLTSPVYFAQIRDIHWPLQHSSRFKTENQHQRYQTKQSSNVAMNLSRTWFILLLRLQTTKRIWQICTTVDGWIE